MPTLPFVSTAWLAEHIDDPDIRVVEIGSSDDRSVYHAGHVPGAVWLLWKAVCWHETDRQFVTPEAMAALFGGLGIGPDTTVVLYGDPIQYGSYAYWAFTMAGHRHLRLLDGGRKKWAEGCALSQDIPDHAAVAYPTPIGDQSMRVGRRDVLDHLGQPDRLLLDLRSPEEYRGDRVIEYSAPFDHGAERAGHIPGARHLYFRELLNDDDTMKSADEIRARFKDVGIDPGRYDEVVCYCRLSHRATMGWLAVSQVLGHNNVKIYDGSWTEWGSIVGVPVEK
jgi:thiosulfate/3-mercaptopyruvate sulfurtransferase